LPRDTGFTHVDPFEDTERPPEAVAELRELGRFTHVDPFEDTERLRKSQTGS